jgi:OmcA/MtrC family decaheme c-type cytochrome
MMIESITGILKSELNRGIVRALLLLVLAITLTGAEQAPYGTHEKASYLDATIVAFLRPGLNLTINSGSIAADGTITVVYTVTDPQGLPLDAAGVYTPGPLSIGYVIGVLPSGQSQYTSYITNTNTGAAGTFTRAAADSGGVVTQLDSGKYQYVYKTRAPVGFDKTATHTIGLYASRNLSSFGVPNNYATATFNFVPAGSAVTHVRDIVRTTACDTCHDQLSAHGGRRRDTALCIICHQPQSTDAASGNTIDFRVFIHKMHMGSQLPSVVAGHKYSVNNTDFSTVVFPADPRRCEICHNQKSGAAQAANYLTNPSRATCGACHDDVNFATGQNHPGGPQFDDNLCSTCHIPQGEYDFDASIKGAHVIPADSSLLTGVQVNLQKVVNGMAGQNPVVSFSVLDKNNNPLPLSNLSTLSLTMAGPTSDYGYTSFGSDVTTPGYVAESALKANCGADGSCMYTFTHAVPSGATGTYAIGVEARRSETVLAGTTAQQTIQYGAVNQVIYFSADGSAVTPRRQVVATTNCQRCHVAFTTIHGGLRNQTEYCVLCHNPSNTDASVRGSAMDPADKAQPPQGVNFNLLVHRIHTGDNLPALGRTYTVVGFGGSHNDFTDVRYPAMSPTGTPGDRRNCSMCHVNGSETNLPLGLNPTIDPQGPINPDPAITAACTGCHADKPSAAHAQSLTDSLGESCTVCHNSTSQFSVSSVHAQY